MPYPFGARGYSDEDMPVFTPSPAGIKLAPMGKRRANVKHQEQAIRERLTGGETALAIAVSLGCSKSSISLIKKKMESGQ